MKQFDPSYRPDWPDEEIDFWVGVFNIHPSLVEENLAGVTAALDARGLVIMSKEDVAAIRDKALEEAAREIECCWGHIATPDIRDAIRSLKSGGQHEG